MEDGHQYSSTPQPSAPSNSDFAQNRPRAITTRALTILLLSVVQLAAASRYCDVADSCKKESGFAVAVGTISTVVCLVYLVLLRFGVGSIPIVGQVVSVFLLVLWIVAAGVNTFRSPFKGTGNGYFATWLAFIECAQLAYFEVPAISWLISQIQSQGEIAGKSQQAISVLLIASIIELCAAATVCDDTSCKKAVAWSVTVGTLSVVLALVSLFVPFLYSFHIYLSAFSSLLWVFGVGVLTFDSPFVGTGNGYFSSWVAFIASLLWFRVSMQITYPDFGSSVEV